VIVCDCERGSILMPTECIISVHLSHWQLVYLFICDSGTSLIAVLLEKHTLRRGSIETCQCGAALLCARRGAALPKININLCTASRNESGCSEVPLRQPPGGHLAFRCQPRSGRTRVFGSDSSSRHSCASESIPNTAQVRNRPEPYLTGRF
jgi:hypothetical protein